MKKDLVIVNPEGFVNKWRIVNNVCEHFVLKTREIYYMLYLKNILNEVI
jgi:hypothetical protein